MRFHQRTKLFTVSSSLYLIPATWFQKGLAILVAIQGRDKALGMQRSRGVPTSRGGVIHNLPDGVRIRESTGSIELLSAPRDEALAQLVKIAKERFKAGPVRLIGRGPSLRQLATMAADHDLELSREHER